MQCLRKLRCFLFLWLLSSQEVFAHLHSASVAAAPNAEQPGKGLVNGLLRTFKKGSSGKGASSTRSGSVVEQGSCSARGVCEKAKDAPRKALDIAANWRGGFTGEKETFDLNTIKLLLTACLATLNVACWLLPLRVSRVQRIKINLQLQHAYANRSQQTYFDF